MAVVWSGLYLPLGSPAASSPMTLHAHPPGADPGLRPLWRPGGPPVFPVRLWKGREPAAKALDAESVPGGGVPGGGCLPS